MYERFYINVDTIRVFRIFDGMVNLVKDCAVIFHCLGVLGSYPDFSVIKYLGYEYNNLTLGI